MEAIQNKMKLYLGGDKDKQIGWIRVFNGVNVIEYINEHQEYKHHNFIILAIGDALKEEYFGAYDRTKHAMPY